MKNKNRIFAGIAATFIVLTMTVAAMCVPVSAGANDKYYTFGGYISGGQSGSNGEFVYAVGTGGSNVPTYRDGFGLLRAYENTYELEGFCLREGGISSYLVEIYTMFPGDSEWQLQRAKGTVNLYTDDWFTLSACPDNYEYIANIEDTTGKGHFKFTIDITGLTFDAGVTMKIDVLCYDMTLGNPILVYSAVNLSCLSVDGTGGTTDVPVPPSQDANYFANLNLIEGNDVFTIGTNKMNEYVKVDCVKSLHPDATTSTTGKADFAGWCAIPNGVSGYIVEIFTAVGTEDEKAISFNSEFNSESCTIVLSELGTAEVNHVDNKGSTVGDFAVNGRYSIYLDFSKMGVDFNETEVTIRIKAYNETDEPFVIATILNFGVEYEKPIVDSPNVNPYLANTEVYIKLAYQGIDYQNLVFQDGLVIFNDCGELDIGAMVKKSVEIITNAYKGSEGNFISAEVHIVFNRTFDFEGYNIYGQPANEIDQYYSRFISGYVIDVRPQSADNRYNVGIEQRGNTIVPVSGENVRFNEMYLYGFVDDAFYNLYTGESFSIGIEQTPNFVSLVGGVFDSMTNTFFSLTNFDVLGVNIANLILGLITLVVTIVILKKVL